eukprot:Clim_evm27s191 gene=Clim_evmTU27s191
MNETVRNDLRQAISTLQDGRAGNQQRIEAIKYCEAFKDNSSVADVLPYCLDILDKSQGRSHADRHFALQVLLHIVQHRWNDDCTQQEKSDLKDISLKLLANQVYDILNEAVYVKEKMAQLVVEIAKREWPQQWPYLFGDLMKIAESGDTQVELVLITLRTLAEDIVIYNEGMKERRRKELITSLTNEVEGVFGFVRNLLERWVSEYEACNGNAARIHNLRVPIMLASASLDLITAFINWVPFSAIYNNRVIPLMCDILRESELRLRAAGCLMILFTRKGKTEERAPLLGLLDHLDLITSATAVDRTLDGRPIPVEDQNNFIKQLAQAMVNLGSMQLLPLLEDQPTLSVPNLQGYLELLLIIFDHPSMTVSALTLSLWVQIYKVPVVTSSAAFQAVEERVVNTAAKKIVRSGDPNLGGTDLATQYNTIEFDDNVNYLKKFASYRQSILDLVRAATVHDPQKTTAVAVSWLQKCLRDPIDYGRFGKLYPGSQRQCATVNTPAYLEFDGMARFVEACIASWDALVKKTGDGIPSAPEQAAMNYFLEGLKALMGYEPQDALITSQYFTVLGAYIPVLKRTDAATVVQVTRRIMEYVLYRQPEEADFNVHERRFSEDTIATRRKACTTLIKVGVDLANELNAYFSELCESVQNIIQNNLVTESERVYLLEALVGASNSIQQLETRMQFLESILSIFENDWNGQEISAIVSDPREFIARTGIGQTFDNTQEMLTSMTELSQDQTSIILASAQTRHLRRNLLALVSGFHAVLKRAHLVTISDSSTGQAYQIHPCAGHTMRTLPNLLALVRTLHSLWLPEMRENIGPAFQQILEISDIEKLHTLGLMDMREQLLKEEARYSFRWHITAYRSWLGTVREMCYNAMAYMPLMGPEFYSIPNLERVIAESMFSYITSMENRHLRALLRTFAVPYFVKCPDLQRMQVTGKLLPQLIMALMDRLRDDWAKVNAMKAGAEAEGRHDEPDGDGLPIASLAEAQEMIMEKGLRDLSRQVLDFLNDMICINELPQPFPALEPSYPEVSKLTGTAYFIFDLGQTENTPELILFVIASACTYWNDTGAVRKAVLLLSKLVPYLIKLDRFHKVIGNGMLLSLIKALSIHGQHEVCQTEILKCILEIYVHARTLSNVVVDTLLTVPDVTVTALTDLDSLLAQEKTERARRDAMKKVLKAAIAVNVGQQFKRRINIQDLSTQIMKIERRKSFSLDDRHHEDFSFHELFGGGDL